MLLAYLSSQISVADLVSLNCTWISPSLEDEQQLLRIGAIIGFSEITLGSSWQYPTTLPP